MASAVGPGALIQRHAVAVMAALAAVACGGGAGNGDGGSSGAGLPPGSPCGHTDDAGQSTITSADVHLCQMNPRIPACVACVSLPNDAGALGVCVLACRVGMQGDCPAG